MKALSLAVALCLALAGTAFAAEPTDREALVQHLERTSELFLKSVEGLSDGQWNFKMAEDKWSVAQCAEHIAAAESFIRAAIVQSLAKPATRKVLREGVRKDDVVLTAVVDRTTKFQAPEPLAPQNRFGSPAAAVEEFRRQRAETIALVQGEKDLRKYASKHPGFGQLDAHGWILFLSGHTERHTLQIEEIKSMDAFPVR
jgi:hypothetical protein